jgi:hypothetical protein
MPQDHEITLDIATPAGLFVHDFAKTTKVAEVIKTAIEAKGLDASERFDLVYQGNVLPPERPLVSFPLEDGAKLELVATGSGV